MLVEYVWCDANGILRSKAKVIYEKRPAKLEDLKLPFWNYDGSSTGDANVNNSEVILKPQSVFPDPFRGGECIMVLCDTYTTDLTPLSSNTRHASEKVFKKWSKSKAMFGLEQEFFLMKDNAVLGSDTAGVQEMEQNRFYCGTGGNSAIGRECVESAFKRCILAGINVTGMNAEVAPAQWEIQLCAEGIAAADQLVMMRYILNRTAEMYGYWINYSPKPMANLNGSGCHVNFSTESMRNEGGYSIIKDVIVKLEKNHEKHIDKYGVDNRKRLTGLHETSEFDTFTHGVGDRSASIRIPNDTHKKGQGYFEDRRPASNMDPYVVTSLLLETSLS
jgi:glutamine synthetase